MIFYVVANCDRLDFVFDIAFYNVIYLTQSKKPKTPLLSKHLPHTDERGHDKHTHLNCTVTA